MPIDNRDWYKEWWKKKQMEEDWGYAPEQERCERREDEYCAGKKESRGRPLCPRCGSPEIYYNKHYRSWRCIKEHNFTVPSYGSGSRGYVRDELGERGNTVFEAVIRIAVKLFKKLRLAIGKR